MLIFFSPVSVQAKEVWEDQEIEWYYNNLTATDRLKIRQAMDFAIPRQYINDAVYQGLGVQTVSEINPTVIGYNPALYPRIFNLTKAKGLLAEVFGKQWCDDCDTSITEGIWQDQTYKYPIQVPLNETVTNTPYFNLTLIGLSLNTVNNDPRYLSIFHNFLQIGINVQLKLFSMKTIESQILQNPAGIGYNYDHDGFDGIIFPIQIETDPDYSSNYFKHQFPPIGNNFQWIENPEVEGIITRSLNELHLKDRLSALKEYQDWCYENVPKSIILQTPSVYAVSPELEGFDQYLIGKGFAFNNMTLGTQTNLTYAIRGEIEDFFILKRFQNFNPLLVTDRFDVIVTSNVFGSLVSRRGSYNLTHPVPLIAENWTCSEDGLEWIVTLRKGIKWHDGTPLTAADVIFTYHALFADELGSPKQSLFLKYFLHNQSDIQQLDSYRVKFTFSSFFPYVLSQIFDVPIVQKAQLENIPVSTWKTHPFNNGSAFLVGCGPYEFGDYDGNYCVTLNKSDEYNQRTFGHDPFAKGGSIWWPNATLDNIFIKIVRSQYADDITDTSIKSGKYNILDKNLYYISNWTKSIPVYHSGYILALNHYDPRWGLNPHDPREMYPMDYSNNSFIGIDFIHRLLLGGFVILTFILFIVLLNRKMVSERRKE